ncbi:MAG: phage virion morphogenesis protein [Gemmobacter sp.]|jgi:phage virion morphogenesis protein|nr:phage virion morphogenesis protein [Gemmobacter sp.]
MITIEVRDAEVEQALSRLQSFMADLSEVMGKIGDHLVYSTQERMKAGQSPDGTPFAPRKASTLNAYKKREQKFGPHPLWLTGTMRENIHFQSGSDFVRVGSSAIQAAVMQFGAAQGEFGARIGRAGKPGRRRDHFHHIPWGDIPARPFLGVSGQDRADILAIIGGALEALVEP